MTTQRVVARMETEMRADEALPGLGRLITEPRLSEIRRVLRSRPPAAVADLIERAELRAIRAAGVVRGLLSILVLLLFTYARPPELPTALVTLVGLALAGNAAAAAIPFLLPGHSTLLRRLATPLALYDCAVLALFTLGGTAAVGLPLGTAAALPPFLFGFVLLALAAMRFTPLAVVVVGALVTALLLVPLLQPAPPPMTLGPDAVPLPAFGHEANLMRATLAATVAAILILIVTRSRVMLIEGLRVGAGAANLARYLPAPIAERAARDGIDALSRGAEQPAAVLFADIVGFTALSERLPPQAVGRILTELRGLQRDAIEAQGGIVDKFIGDAVMGVFGVPDPDPAAAGHALAAARSMQAELTRWNEARTVRGEAALKVGTGVHYGPVFAGAVGDAGRLEFAVLGDTVNVAARCEALTRRVDTDLLVTGALLQAAGEDMARWRRVEISRVRGRGGEVELYAPV